MDKVRLDELVNVNIPPELFCSMEAKVMDPEVARKPHEFFESVRAKFGDVVHVTDNIIEGVAFPTLLPMNPEHPHYLLLGMNTVMEVVRDQTRFHQNYGGTMDILMGEGQIAGQNPPHHKPLRNLIMQAFDRKSVESIDEEAIGPIIEALLDKIAMKPSADLVADFTCRVPTLLICEIFGIPTKDVARFAELATDLMNMGVNWDGAMKASAELKVIFDALIEERRVNPGDDLISSLVIAELNGERLTEQEIVSFCRALVPAGIETTTRALSTLLAATLSTEGCWEELRQNPKLITQTIEEAMRWNGPVTMVPKCTAEATTLAGVDLPKNANLWVCVGHANRDPSNWNNVNEFDIHRDRKAHVMFSAGAHFCIGNQLARREMARTLSDFTQRFPNMRLDPDGAKPDVLGIQFRSVDRLDVLTGV